jgi:dihydroorotase
MPAKPTIMSEKHLITNARIVNEGKVQHGSVLIDGQIITGIFDDPFPNSLISQNISITDAAGSFLLPGIIDDQVHFREPGLTQKADIETESKAAVAGGITSFMEMPNTVPQTTTLELLEEKFVIGARKSFANFSFYMGATNDNAEEIVKINPEKVCGIKIFMGSSTGNMLVNNPETLDKIFSEAPVLVAVHCEDEDTIQANLALFKEKYGDQIRPEHHPLIRNHQACLLSSQLAVSLAKKHNTRLHILHLSTADETKLFDNALPLADKRITAEVCAHHLWFTDEDYKTKGNLIKWNPAVKSQADREELWNALIQGKIDIVATDHAPHLIEEKSKPYLQAPSGGPLVQHSLQIMYDAITERNIPIHKLAEWMCHNPALCFSVRNRGFIREGYFADLVILNPNEKYTVTKNNLLYKCNWSPFDGHTFNSTPTHTFVNGNLVYNNGEINEAFRGIPLEFNRD